MLFSQRKIIAITLLLLLVGAIANTSNTSNAHAAESLAPTISVENPLIVNSKRFTLSWDELNKGDIYYFELCADTACLRKIRSLQKAGAPSVNLDNIANGQYYWRVSILDNNREPGAFSLPQPILIENKADASSIENLPGASPNQTQTQAKQISVTRVFGIPWYLCMLILAYLIMLARMLSRYLNK